MVFRARWVESGEKSSKYLLNLEKRNFVYKSITELRITGDRVTKEVEIINLQKDFYKNLYAKKNTIEQDSEYIPDLSNLPAIKEGQKEQLDREITKEEVDEALKNLKNNKSLHFIWILHFPQANT